MTQDYAKLLFPAYTGPRIARYFGGPWSMHLPFAYDLMREFRPSSFVELGVYKGESYFTFCQSAAENGVADVSTRNVKFPRLTPPRNRTRRGSPDVSRVPVEASRRIAAKCTRRTWALARAAPPRQ